jgi:hypothetical protein
VKNYSKRRLAILVRACQVVTQGNAERTSFDEVGLTQESFILKDPSADSDDDNNVNDAWVDEDENLFESSLVVGGTSSFCTSSARDVLKPQINEVLDCLDILNTKISIEKATKLLNDLTNELRLEIAKNPRKGGNIVNCSTVNLNVEENVTKKRRTHASKN